MFVKLKPGASLTFEELKKHLDGKIGKHEMPVALEIRPELPKTPVGKLSKKELKEEERAKATGQGGVDAFPPSSTGEWPGEGESLDEIFASTVMTLCRLPPPRPSPV